MSARESFERMLEDYRQDHTHPVNRAMHMIGIPMILLSLPLLFVSPPLSIFLFVVGWIFQITGHLIEGNVPSFVRNPRYLLVGPRWYFEKVASFFRGPQAATA
jgi:uncharacterized membrane protein YGL010W